MLEKPMSSVQCCLVYTVALRSAALQSMKGVKQQYAAEAALTCKVDLLVYNVYTGLHC